MLFEEMIIGGVIVGIIGTIGFAILCELVPFLLSVFILFMSICALLDL